MSKPTRESTREYYEKYHASPEAKRERAMRNAARREFEEKGLVRKGDGKDVDHRRPLSRGGTNADDNLRVQSRSKNRGYKRDSKNRPI
jgi:hypothetical protein